MEETKTASLRCWPGLQFHRSQPNQTSVGCAGHTSTIHGGPIRLITGLIDSTNTKIQRNRHFKCIRPSVLNLWVFDDTLIYWNVPLSAATDALSCNKAFLNLAQYDGVRYRFNLIVEPFFISFIVIVHHFIYNAINQTTIGYA